MANNCLVTKLKGTVSADLPKYGDLIIPIKESARTAVAANPTYISVIAGGEVVTEYNQDYSKLIIHNSYSPFDLTSIRINPIPFKLDLESIKYCGATELFIDYSSNSDIIGNLSELPKSLKKILLSNIEVDIAEFGVLTQLTEIYCFSNYNWSKLYGSIEDFVQAQIDNGRTSCTNLILGYNSNAFTISGHITYGGNDLYGTACKKLSWNGSVASITLVDII